MTQQRRSERVGNTPESESLSAEDGSSLLSLVVNISNKKRYTSHSNNVCVSFPFLSFTTSLSVDINECSIKTASTHFIDVHFWFVWCHVVITSTGECI